MRRKLWSRRVLTARRGRGRRLRAGGPSSPSASTPCYGLCSSARRCSCRTAVVLRCRTWACAPGSFSPRRSASPKSSCRSSGPRSGAAARTSASPSPRSSARSAWRRRACTRQRRPRTRSASSSRARSPRRRGACRTRSNQTSAPAPRSQPPSRRRWQRSLRFTPVRRRGTSASRCRGTRRARTSTACSSRCRTAGGPLFAPRSPSDSAPTRWPQSSSTRPKSQRPTTSAASTLRNSWTPWSAPRWRRRTCRIRRRLAASSPASAACATASTPPCRAPPMPATSEGTAAAWPAAEASLRTTTF
mmetsp:Transcript_27203/g.91442  ORF Transcript_27203/g.91442 Transcript_27203/m.91442 type:complete len:303 (+) Transcript_27203:254-1162(+)